MKFLSLLLAALSILTSCSTASSLPKREEEELKNKRLEQLERRASYRGPLV